MAAIKIKRVYDDPDPSDGCRVLADRLWPRGLKKEDAKIDVWLREIAPSPELRKWFNHDPEKWKSFSKKYDAELDQSATVQDLLALVKENKTITLLFGARDKNHTHALVLQQYILQLQPKNLNT